jgi:hypothetical protein
MMVKTVEQVHCRRNNIFKLDTLLCSCGGLRLC